MTTVIAVCRSEKKGTRKTPVGAITLRENYGVENDAHADYSTHRQVSLLAIESIDKMQGKGIVLEPGDFSENITTQGTNLALLPIGTRFQAGSETIMELTQPGKECHAACAIRKQVGDCILPREGIFTRVIKGGTIKPGDTLTILDNKAV